jgi:hypothetical protein
MFLMKRKKKEKNSLSCYGQEFATQKDHNA